MNAGCLPSLVSPWSLLWESTLLDSFGAHVGRVDSSKSEPKKLKPTPLNQLKDSKNKKKHNSWESTGGSLGVSPQCHHICLPWKLLSGPYEGIRWFSESLKKGSSRLAISRGKIRGIGVWAAQATLWIPIEQIHQVPLTSSIAKHHLHLPSGGELSGHR